MYTTRGVFFQNNLSQNVRPRRNLLAHEELFLYEYARYLLHEQLVSEGLLSPYADPFQPPTDRLHRETERNNNEQRNNIDKEIIAAKLNKETKDIFLQEEKSEDKENGEWKTVKGNSQGTYMQTSNNIQEEIEKEKKGGYYDGLQEEEEGQEEIRQGMIEKEVEEKSAKDTKGIPEIQHKRDIGKKDINNMSISELEYELTETCGNKDWKSVHLEMTEDHDADIRMKTAEGDLEKDVKRECEELGGTNDCRLVSSVLTEEQDDKIKNFNAELLYDTEENFISNVDSIGDVKDDELTTYKQEIEAVRYNNVLLSSRLE